MPCYYMRQKISRIREEHVLSGVFHRTLIARLARLEVSDHYLVCNNCKHDLLVQHILDNLVPDLEWQECPSLKDEMMYSLKQVSDSLQENST